MIKLKLAATRRLDLAVLAALEKNGTPLTRARLKAMFKAGRILVNDRQSAPADGVKDGDTAAIEGWTAADATAARAAPSPDGCFLNVVFEDNDLLVLDKLSGVPSIAHSPAETRTAVGAALAKCPDLADVGRGGLEPGILHRLDTGTSGLIVFAKTNAEYERLRALWTSGGVKKTYRALVRIPPGTPAPVLCVLESPLAHDPKSSKRMIALDTPEKLARAKAPLPAFTGITGVQEKADGLFDLTIEIRTGVMHQIRCHLASRLWPVLGDKIYKGVPSSRLWLHAWRLGFVLNTGKSIALESPFG